MTPATHTAGQRVRLWCGCEMAVLPGPGGNGAVLRAIIRKHARCRVRAHLIGERVYLWELLPPPPHIRQWAP